MQRQLEGYASQHGRRRVEFAPLPFPPGRRRWSKLDEWLRAADDSRHVGLVVDDKEAARAALKAAGVNPIGGPFLDFRDPWGNRIEIVSYDNIQFTKAPNVLRGMGLTQ
jgi:hypothetical protein